MDPKTNQRRDIRLKYKNTIQYEECLENGVFDTPVATSTFDISARGIGFYAPKEFKLKSRLKITCNVSDNERISFIATVVRLQLNQTERKEYLIGAEIVDIAPQDKEKLVTFLQGINIVSLLDSVNLDNVVDIHFMVGYPIVLKKMGRLKPTGNILDEFTVKNLLLNLLDEESYARFMKTKDINFITPVQ